MKKFVSILLSIVMLLSITTGLNFSAQAASHTQAEAVSWAKSKVDKALDYDGKYGAQCVDLIYYYYQYLGVPISWESAEGFRWNNLPSGWQRIKYSNGFVAQPGDIAVWKVNHDCGTFSTDGSGHIGIIVSADKSGFNAVNQNHLGRMYCTLDWFNASNLDCVIRPNFSAKLNAPTNLKVDTVNGKLNISWSSVSGATGYVVYAYTKSNCSEFALKKQVNANYLNEVSLTPGRYWIYVHAINGNNSSDGCGPYDYLSAPSNVKVTEKDGSFYVSWDSVPGANNYYIKTTHPDGTPGFGSPGKSTEMKFENYGKNFGYGTYTFQVQSFYKEDMRADIKGAFSEVVSCNYEKPADQAVTPSTEAPTENTSNKKEPTTSAPTTEPPTVNAPGTQTQTESVSTTNAPATNSPTVSDTTSKAPTDNKPSSNTPPANEPPANNPGNDLQKDQEYETPAADGELAEYPDNHTNTEGDITPDTPDTPSSSSSNWFEIVLIVLAVIAVAAGAAAVLFRKKKLKNNE